MNSYRIISIRWTLWNYNVKSIFPRKFINTVGLKIHLSTKLSIFKQGQPITKFVILSFPEFRIKKPIVAKAIMLYIVKGFCVFFCFFQLVEDWFFCLDSDWNWTRGSKLNAKEKTRNAILKSVSRFDDGRQKQL